MQALLSSPTGGGASAGRPSGGGTDPGRAGVGTPAHTRNAVTRPMPCASRRHRAARDPPEVSQPQTTTSRPSPWPRNSACARYRRMPPCLGMLSARRPWSTGPRRTLHRHRDVPCHGHDLLAPGSGSGAGAGASDKDGRSKGTTPTVVASRVLATACTIMPYSIPLGDGGTACPHGGISLMSRARGLVCCSTWKNTGR